MHSLDIETPKSPLIQRRLLKSDDPFEVRFDPFKPANIDEAQVHAVLSS